MKTPSGPLAWPLEFPRRPSLHFSLNWTKLLRYMTRFWELLAGKKVLATLSGHLHISYDQEINGIQVQGTRSTAFPFALQDEKLICLWPPQVRVVTIDGDELSSRLFEVPLD